MKHKICICLIVIIVLISITSCFAAVISNADSIFFTGPTEIRGGFSPELIRTLNTRYQRSIPEKANFIKGLNTNSFRDPMVVILFECAIDDLEPWEDDSGFGYSYVFQALNLNKSVYKFQGYDEEIMADWFDDFGGLLDYCLGREDDLYTKISYSLRGNTLIIRFVGWHPGETFN